MDLYQVHLLILKLEISLYLTDKAYKIIKQYRIVQEQTYIYFKEDHHIYHFFCLFKIL